MLSHLTKILTEFEALTNSFLEVFSRYLFYLILDAKKHELRTAAEHFGYHESSYSRLLTNTKTLVAAKTFLNRAARRRLQALRNQKEVFLLIDATMIGRSGKKFENRGKFHTGRGFIDGYKVTNFCIFANGELIPIACLPHYCKKYCAENDLLYQTEPERIVYWIEHLTNSGFLPDWLVGKLHFLMDSGYDAKPIQLAIKGIGANFTMSIKKDRQVNGMPVSEYFRTHRCIPNRTIRFTVGNSSKKPRKTSYRIRSAGKSHLKGYGPICVVSSKKLQRSGSKSAQKFLVTSKINQSARRTVEVYAFRWKIETWHRTMKQKFGYGDCRILKFRGIESHLNISLLAYNLSMSGDQQLPKPGTTLENYLSARQWQEADLALSRFGGKLKVKAIAAAEIRALVTLKACA